MSKSMVLVTLHYTVPLDQIDAHLVEHRELLMDLCARGIVICSGPKNPREGGIILMNLDSVEKAEKILSNDPFYREHLATYTYTLFTPVKCAPAFQVFLDEGTN